MALHAKKRDIIRNIKVTMNEEIAGITRRSSTTLSYVICDYYFGVVLYPDKALKAKSDKRFSDTSDNYRKWLENEVREWAKTQPQARSVLLERTMIEAIYNKGYNDGIAKNKDNHSLDI